MNFNENKLYKINDLIIYFMGVKPIYRRFIFLIIDIAIIFISFEFVKYLINSNISFSIQYFISLIFVAISVYTLTGQYKGISRYVGSYIFYSITIRNTIILLLLYLSSFHSNLEKVDLKVVILLGFILNFLMIFTRVLIRDLLSNFISSVKRHKIKVVIYGAGEGGAQLAASLKFSSNYNIEYFVDDNKNLWNRKIFGIPIYPPKRLYKHKENIDKVLFAIPSLKRSLRLNLINKLQSQSIKILQMPSIDKIESGEERIDSLKPIVIEDLLSREVVEPVQSLLEPAIEGKSIFVTGAGGSIGSELSKQIIKLKPSIVILFELSEHNLYKIHLQLSKNISKDIQLKAFLGDAKDEKLLRNIFIKYKVQTVFHAAAYKHVSLVEANPLEGIANNVLSTKSICNVSLELKVRNFIFISSDKAVRPTNVMGASKRLSEIVVQGFDKKVNSNENYLTKFSIVRFGNVLGSSGSVVPLFRKQINEGGPVTVTHPDVIRYFMTISEAAQLVIQATQLSKGGEVYLLDMGEPVKILDLAKQMIRLSGLTIRDKENNDGDIEIKIIGLQPGEKLYEELLIDANSESTPHPLIYRAKEKDIPSQLLSEKLKDLEKAIVNKQQTICLDILEDLIPEWKRSKNFS